MIRSELETLDGTTLVALLLPRLERLEADNAALRARVAELEAKLNTPPKTPDNSSTPPSSAGKKNKDGKMRKKRRFHPGAYRALDPDPTSRRDVFADHCPHCHADVRLAAQGAVHAYDHIDIPPVKPDITRVRLHGGVCPCCSKRFKAPAPQGMQPGSPFGENLKAYVFYLRFVQAIPLARLRRLLVDLFGLEISEGALVAMLKRAGPAFHAAYERVRQALLSGTAIASDETGLRVGARSWWLWTFHHGDNACFVIDPSRGKKVVEEFLDGIRPHVWLSDRLGSQRGWADAHQFCLAHLLRDAQYAIDSGDDIFAPGFKKIVKSAIHTANRIRTLSPNARKAARTRLDNRLSGLLKLEATNPAGVKLQKAMKRARRNLFVFLDHPDVEPTNNAAERALRPCAVFRKVTNGSRAEWGAVLYAEARTVIETARRRGINLFDAIKLTLEGRDFLKQT